MYQLRYCDIFAFIILAIHATPLWLPVNFIMCVPISFALVLFPRVVKMNEDQDDWEEEEEPHDFHTRLAALGIA
jgi:hypothetical protein